MPVLCPGSFDPITLGHLDVIERAAALFDEVLVGVGRNTTKNGLFDPEERVRLIADSTAHLPGVRPLLMSGLLVDFCADHGVRAVVKGIRTGADFDHELQMAQLNRALADPDAGAPGVETIVLPSSVHVGFISSTMIREISLLGGDVSRFVPEPVSRALAARAERR